MGEFDESPGFDSGDSEELISGIEEEGQSLLQGGSTLFRRASPPAASIGSCNSFGLVIGC